jgi:glucose/arabinose dehydrogenase
VALYDFSMRLLRLLTFAGWLVAFTVRSEAQPPITSVPYASGFNVPVAFVQDPTDRMVQFVVEQSGRIRVVRNGVVLPNDFLDLRNFVSFGGERGLLGMAFAPDVSSGRFFVNYTNTQGNTVISRFRRSGNPLIADPASRFDLRWGGPGGSAFIFQPYENHNGGNLVFGPEGYLYIGLGDGGASNDPAHRAQDPRELLGKMLRIDINVADSDPAGYRVPPDNPFVDGGPVNARPEIWSFGLRNPWRYSFDDPSRGGTGALVIADVGQDSWEEIDYEPAGRSGRNYGWRNREGAHDNVTSLPPAYVMLMDPIFEYDRSVGQVVTGGYVYRGRALGPPFQGRYFFADFAQGRVWSLGLNVDPISGEASVSGIKEHTSELAGVGNVSSFGVDADGELYIVSYGGTIWKVIGAGVRGVTNSSDLLSKLPNPRPPAGRAISRMGSGAGLIVPFGVFRMGQLYNTQVIADFDGDGQPDIGAYNTLRREWFILFSAPRNQSGLPENRSVPRDIDGDGVTDLAIYRPQTGQWYVRQSSNGVWVTL